jgi:hypothetical protein
MLFAFEQAHWSSGPNGTSGITLKVLCEEEIGVALV